MLKIGEFAKICGVNVQTLRYYDKIGVLCADRIDEESGYRYYNPDKIKTFQLIEQLKQLDFSLDEIKEFLACSPAQQCRIYSDKKLALMKGIHQIRNQIDQIDDNCENAQPGVLPLNQQFMQTSFEDDPCVIGKWVYCGDLEKSGTFANEQDLVKNEILHKELFFLPGGCQTWKYFWSKDCLYYILPTFNVIVPNPYRILQIGETTYMEIEWGVDSFQNDASQTVIRIYKQENTRRYAERETHVARDNVDVPFVPDDRLLGEWETVDLVSDPSEFRSDQRRCQSDFWVVGMQFFNRGMCTQTRKYVTGEYQAWLQYSAGMIIEYPYERVWHYQMHTENGADYLIAEYKYSDYNYTGKVQQYYVLKRKTS